jgi:hypothetical protein
MAEYIDRSDVFNPQTPIALKGDVWSVLTLDSLNRLKISPIRFGDFYKDVSLVIGYVYVNEAAHSTTTRWSYTLASDKIGVISYVRARLPRPSAGTIVTLVLMVANYHLCFFFCCDDAPYTQNEFEYAPHVILPPGTNIAITTSSTDTTTRNFFATVFINVFPLGT